MVELSLWKHVDLNLKTTFLMQSMAETKDLFILKLCILSTNSLSMKWIPFMLEILYEKCNGKLISNYYGVFVATVAEYQQKTSHSRNKTLPFLLCILLGNIFPFFKSEP